MGKNRKEKLITTISLFVFLCLCGFLFSQQPGKQKANVVLLPNGWKLAPAGHHIKLDDLPLEMLESQDGHYLVVTNNGFSKPVLSVIDLQKFAIVNRLQVNHAWLGLAWSPDGKKLYSSAAASGTIDVFKFSNGVLTRERSFQSAHPTPNSFIGGIAATSDGKRLYAVEVFGNRILMLDAESGKVLKTQELDAEPYTVLLSPDGKTLFVSLWGGSRVLELDALKLTLRRTLVVGEHPNSMVLTPDASRLFVACASTNSVWAIQLKDGKGAEQISVALYPQAPAGSTPTGLGISPDGKTLLVANSDNNCVALIDISHPGKCRVQGFIPAGWYPTAARFSHDGKNILILNGKGLNPVPKFNPKDYIARMLLGTLSIVKVPTSEQLASFNQTVYELTPYSDRIRLTPPGIPQRSPIPRKVGDPSPIKYIFYIIRENRTYDQVFGDMKTGNGDPGLCLFCENVTPNAHALARQFVLLDNFYVDAEVSADGHAFSTGAYANDFIEKTWPMYYGERGGRLMTKGGGPWRNAYGNIAAPPKGYIWDAAKRAGLTVRSYGEFGVRGPIGGKDSGVGAVRANVPGLEGFINPDYPVYDLTIPDNHRVDVWLKEFQKFEKEGGLPRLSILQLGNDHTVGTTPGQPTPQAMVAENDLALGRVVDAISHSKFWKESAIFVLEDDAQDGPDHVDAHRSVSLIISPYTQRGITDSTMYTTSGFLRTIELILGIEPMTQYDAAATPAFHSFQETPVLKPYVQVSPRISLQEKNTASSYGAAESMAMYFREPDRIPMGLMNEILWKSIRGADSIMPPPVRAAFLKDVDMEDYE